MVSTPLLKVPHTGRPPNDLKGTTGVYPYRLDELENTAARA